MPMPPSIRLTYGLTALLAVLSMSFALYLQHGQGLEPCPLCIFERVSVIAVGIIALLATVHNPLIWGRRVYALLMLLAAIAGAIVAGRHVWLQHLPPEQVPACGPGLDYWLAALPLQDVLRQVFHGSGECAKIDWLLFGLSLPSYVLILSVGFAGVSVWQLLRQR